MLGQSKAQAPVPPVPPPPPREVCVVCAVSCGCFSLSKSKILQRFCQKSPRNLLSHLMKIYDFWWIDRFQMCFIFLHLDSKYVEVFFPLSLVIFLNHFGWKRGALEFHRVHCKLWRRPQDPQSFFIEPPIFLAPPSCQRTWRTLWHGHDWESHAPRNLWSSSSNFWKTPVWPLCWLENHPRLGETLLKDSSSKLIGGASTNCQTRPSCVDHLKRTSAGSTGLQKMMAVLRPPKVFEFHHERFIIDWTW